MNRGYIHGGAGIGGASPNASVPDYVPEVRPAADPEEVTMMDPEEYLVDYLRWRRDDDDEEELSEGLRMNDVDIETDGDEEEEDSTLL
ncbi:hypothetical protein Tco_1006403 [Tanacetum coccineum]|uniref:Uncharacterized protein n=1 Tax=Tanacetum coccineum TaxID=301880 RepID=A0ABQ5FHN3_9ASTR